MPNSILIGWKSPEHDECAEPVRTAIEIVFRRHSGPGRSRSPCLPRWSICIWSFR